MAAAITAEEANRLGMELGAFVSLEKLVQEFGVSPKTKSRIIREFFKMLAEQIVEAEREVEHLRGAVRRLENTCRRGASQDTFGRPNLNAPYWKIFTVTFGSLTGGPSACLKPI